MKTTPNRIGKLIGSLVIGGCLAVPAMLTAQEPGPPPGPPPPPRDGMTPQNGVQPERVKRVMGRIEALRREGKNEEAAQLQMRLRSAMARQRMGPHGMGPQGMGPQWMGKRPMGRQAMGMQMARPANPAQPERKPEIKGERRKEKAPGQPLPARAKIQNLKRAAEFLQAAGYEDQANKARKEIGRLEEQARRESAPADANAGLKEEVNKLRREIEELRQQNRRLKEAAAPKRDQPRPDDAREPVRRPNADAAPNHDPAQPHPEMRQP